MADYWFGATDGLKHFLGVDKQVPDSLASGNAALDAQAAALQKVETARQKAALASLEHAAAMAKERDAAADAVKKSYRDLMDEALHPGESKEQSTVRRWWDNAQYQADPTQGLKYQHGRMQDEANEAERYRKQIAKNQDDAAQAKQITAAHDPNKVYKDRADQLDRLRAAHKITMGAWIGETRKAKEELDEALHPDKKTFESWDKETRSARDKFFDMMEDLDAAVAGKKISKAAAGRIGFKAERDYAGSMSATAALPDLLAKGSMEEYRARVGFQSKADSPQLLLLREAQQQTASLTRIRAAVEKHRQEVMQAP